jgi:hypothetical protein
MNHGNLQCRFPSGLTVLLAGALVIAGCQNWGTHPDVQAAVYKALDSNDFGSVVVSQNRETGVITLTGIVGASNRKPQAEAIAQQAAPGYTIDDKIRVESAGL